MPDASTPAFPASTSDRERGRFRPSTTARQTVVAVSDDAGFPLGVTTDDLLAGILIQLRIQNAHLALVNGEVLTEEDMEDDNN